MVMVVMVLTVVVLLVMVVIMVLAKFDILITEKNYLGHHKSQSNVD